MMGSDDTDPVKHVAVLYERLGHIETTLVEIKEGISKDRDMDNELRKEIQAVKIDVAVFKTKFVLLGVIGSAVVSGLVAWALKALGAS